MTSTIPASQFTTTAPASADMGYALAIVGLPPNSRIPTDLIWAAFEFDHESER